MGTTENTDETAEYIEQGMRRIVMGTIDALTTRADCPLPAPTEVAFDFDRGYLTLTVADRAALVAWRRQVLGPDLGEDVTVTSWCGWQTTVQVGRTPEEISARLRAEWDRYTLPAIVPPPADHPDAEQWMANEYRRQTIAALRILATYLEDHPDAPTPDNVVAGVVYIAGGRSGRVAAVESFAEVTGAELDIDDTFAEATRHFGPVEYRAIASLPEPTAAEVVSAALEG